MKLDPQEQELFRALSKSDSGKVLAGYLKKVQDFIHDSRNWKNDENKESAAIAARAIQECLIDKIRQNSGGGVILNESE